MMSSSGFAFESVACRYPARPAVRQPGRMVTYRDLDEQSRALAGRITAGQIVAVTSRDRFDYVVGMLAILRAGGIVRNQLSDIERCASSPNSGREYASSCEAFTIIKTDIASSITLTRSCK